MEQLEKEAGQEYEAMTSEEKQIRKKYMEMQLKRFYERIEARGGCRRILNQDRLKEFRDMSVKAVWWAGEMGADLTVDIAENFRGSIKFKSGTIVFDKENSMNCRGFFSELMLKADEVWINAEGEENSIVFWFELCDILKN